MSLIAYLPPIIPPGRRAEDLVLRVEQITSRSGLGQFASTPRHLYRDDPRWVPPFSAARRDALWPDRNPFLSGGAVGAFRVIAQNLGLGDETMGVLAAWWKPRKEDVAGAWGRWGLLEAVNLEEVADPLFYEAENWIFEHTPGIVGIRGPWSPEPLVAPGLLTDGFDAQPLALLPYNPPYYPEMVEGQGYAPGLSWRAYRLDLPTSIPRYERTETLAAETWRAVASAYAVQPDVTEPHESLIPGLGAWLNHIGGGGQFGFNRSWEGALRAAFRRGVAVTPEDGAACFGIPDLGPALRLSGGRLFPLAWPLFEIGLRRTRRLHIFPPIAPPEWDAGRLAELYAGVIEAAAAAGYRQAVVAPVADGDERTIQALALSRAAPVQQFTVYQKDL